MGFEGGLSVCLVRVIRTLIKRSGQCMMSSFGSLAALQCTSVDVGRKPSAQDVNGKISVESSIPVDSSGR